MAFKTFEIMSSGAKLFLDGSHIIDAFFIKIASGFLQLAHAYFLQPGRFHHQNLQRNLASSRLLQAGSSSDKQI